MNERYILLASVSPRRRQLLSWIQPGFSVTSSDIDETPLLGEPPIMYVKRMAREKSEKAALESPGILVVASDTIVELDGQILGKPGCAEDARGMLGALRGKTHHVFTAITILQPGSAPNVMDCCVVDVPMRAYSDDELEKYISSGDPFDKAGAYAIQNREFHPVEHFSGCYACVMGLPLCHLSRHLIKMGMQIAENPVSVCSHQLAYRCEISSSVLSFTDQITC
jgi:septum formation protein